MKSNLKVMMATEGTYPFHHGGVSTWCDALIKSLNTNIDFTLYSIMMNPFVTQKFNLPENVKLLKVPLWGTEEPSEHLDIPFSKVYLAKKRTTEEVIKSQFIPLFLNMIEEIVSNDKNPDKFGKSLNNLYLYFQKYEYKESFKSKITWDTYKQYIISFTDDPGSNMHKPGIYSIIQSLGWLYRFMTVLNTPLPRVDITHSAAAAFCGIPCVLAKLQYKAPFLLTEHGVYLREQYLSLSKRGYSSFLNTFLIRLIHSVVSVNYYYADQVSPVCEYNIRWEERFGVNYEKIKAIYNGVDQKIFSPRSSLNKGKQPTVISIARIDPVKDIQTQLRAADIVRKEIPDVKFIVYGDVSVPEYYEECLKLKEELQLGESFEFAGHTSDTPEAYGSGDIAILSSITEGFPYSVVEGMMSGKPIIATDVGGIREALGDCGILVPPRNPEELAKWIITLLKDVKLRTSLSEEARERALTYFTIDKAQQAYYQSYKDLSELRTQKKDEKDQDNQNNVILVRKRQLLYMERGFALIEKKLYNEAIDQLRLALQQAVDSPAVPVIFTKIADAYNALGEFDKALKEMDKASIFIKMMSLAITA